MAVLKIRTLPDPVLRQKAKKVTKIDGSIQKLIDDMIDTIRTEPDRGGLAAPQVGVLLRVAIVELPGQELIIMINPKIVKREGECVVQEACLSIPGYYDEVKRAAVVKVRAQDRQGKKFRLKAEGLLAETLQHEIDHLNGTLYLDHIKSPVNPLRKIRP